MKFLDNQVNNDFMLKGINHSNKQLFKLGTILKMVLSDEVLIGQAGRIQILVLNKTGYMTLSRMHAAMQVKA